MYLNTFDRAMRERFGKKMYRLSLDCGFTCPNRDGTAGTGGCIFCSAGGAGNFAGRGGSLDGMLAAAKERIRNKTGRDCGYLAYFQSFTNTYAPLETLRNLFCAAAEKEELEALSIATRPDCLQPETVSLLSELNRKKPVWVELGLQTVSNETAQRINRCYETEVYDKAVSELRKNGIEVIPHIMLGLPGEGPEEMRATVRHVAAQRVDGVKLHLTHVLKNTPLAEQYRQGTFRTLSFEEYRDLLCELIEFLPRETVIHRFTGDGDKRELLAPLWSADKKRVLNDLNRAFLIRDVEQGRRFLP